MIKKPRGRDPGPTRAALLEAGSEEFARLGFAGARTRDIARRARVNQALIRYHFGGKAGLHRAVFKEAMGAAREPLEAIRRSQAPPAERFGMLVEALGRFLEAKPHFPALLLREYLSGGRHLSQDIMAEVGRFFATTRLVVEDGVRRRAFRPVDPHELHLSLVGSLAFFHASRPWRERAKRRGELPATAPRPEDYVDHVRRVLLEGIVSSTAGRTRQRRKQ